MSVLTIFIGIPLTILAIISIVNNFNKLPHKKEVGQLLLVIALVELLVIILLKLVEHALGF